MVNITLHVAASYDSAVRKAASVSSVQCPVSSVQCPLSSPPPVKTKAAFTSTSTQPMTTDDRLTQRGTPFHTSQATPRQTHTTSSTNAPARSLPENTTELNGAVQLQTMISISHNTEYVLYSALIMSAAFDMCAQET